MTDIFSPEKRSWLMSQVKQRGNLSTEKKLAEILKKRKITGWRRNHKLAGNPDFVFLRQKIAVFVDGCFWHYCARHKKIPKSNRKFWREKLLRNRRRDKETNRILRSAGWRVIRFWEHDLAGKGCLNSKIYRLRKIIREAD